MKAFCPSLCALLGAVGLAFATPPVPVALLSVATEAATLTVATPESRRPVFTPKPLPFSDDILAKLTDYALVDAVKANAKAAEKNEKDAAIFAQRDRDLREKRENAARHEFSLSDLGKAVAKSPGFFSEAVAGTKGLSLLSSDVDGYVKAPESARLVRILFGEPRKNPVVETPGTSNVPVILTMKVLIKIETSDGKKLKSESFEQTEKFANPDKLLGPAYSMALEQLVKDATAAVVARLVIDK